MEEREEGELTDDFEEVSDCSMSSGSPLNCGKSVSAELLSDVSLSSVGSEKEYNTRMFYERSSRSCYQRNQRKLPPRGLRRKPKISSLSPTKNNHHSKRRRKSLLHHSDSEEDGNLDPKSYIKLRQLHHEAAPCTLLHTSLKTRLKGFIKSDSQSEGDKESEPRNNSEIIDKAAEKDGKQSEAGDENTDRVEGKKTEDVELQELRIAALKSFVIENHKKRKNKAAITENKESSKEVEEINDVNKENDQGVINNDEKKQTEKTVSELSNGRCETDAVEEDEDILRTMVLASMSTKLSVKPKAEDAPAEVPTILKVKPSNKVESKPPPMKDKKCENNFLPNRVVVQPLIIKVGDSDSDSDMEVVVEKQPSESVVAEFLKRQREKVEAKQMELKKAVLASTAAKSKPPINMSSSTNIAKTPNNSKKPYDDFLLDKSELKLLPRSQQLEYRKLKMQLLNATRKKLQVKRPSFTKRENTSPLVNLNAKKVPKLLKNDATNLNIKSGVVNGNIDFKLKLQDKNIVNSTQDLQITLDALQIRKNGRLQIKGKYQSLKPLLNKINRMSNERMVQEKEIELLLQKLQQARNKFKQIDGNFSNLVQQLVTGKTVIDQRTFKLKTFTASTTKKINVPMQSTTPIPKVETKKNLVEEKYVESVAVDTNLISGENVCDTNNITQEVPQSSSAVSSFTKYTSPLDNRCQIGDPQAIMCPYDLLGVCKDKECAYVHC